MASKKIMWIAECILCIKLSQFRSFSAPQIYVYAWLLMCSIPGYNFLHFLLQNVYCCHSAPWDKPSVSSIIYAEHLSSRLFVWSFVRSSIRCSQYDKYKVITKWHSTFDMSYHCIIIFADFLFKLLILHLYVYVLQMTLSLNKMRVNRHLVFDHFILQFIWWEFMVCGDVDLSCGVNSSVFFYLSLV